MNAKEQKQTSKFLSLVLRHDPGRIGIELDDTGWTNVDTLLTQMGQHGLKLNLDELQNVVANNDKQRFEFSDDKLRIRARQGHSVTVELDHPEAIPPEFLFHGTPQQAVASILETGLKPMQRHHVHLHQDPSLATSVGGRRGKPVLLRVRALEMSSHNLVFYLTPNEVWLVDSVPPNFIDVIDSSSSM